MESVETIISLFQPFFDQDATPIDELFPEPTFPRIEVHLLSDLFNLSKETLKKNKALLEISSPMIVVGDLHGNLIDFLKILYYFGAPPKSRYLFLGDFVDRGRYSVNVISLILALMVKYPNDIYLIRGNHEFSHINRAYGFFDECMNTYGTDQIWNQFQEVFYWLPLAAVIGNSVFCVHGGLSPLLTSLDSIRNLPLPIPNYFNNTMISDLVWSDPVDTVRGFQLNHRGSGQIFGPDVVENFLRYNKLKIMIRGHQCTLAGFKPFANFMGITVFSSSNYCSSICNKCGVVAIKDREVLFYNIEESELGLSPSATMCLPIDGDVGLKRIFRTISRPDFHKEISPTIQSPLQGQNQNEEEEEEEEDEDDFTFQMRNQQSNPFNCAPKNQFIPQQQQYNSFMQMRVNMILNQQQLNNSILQKNIPSIPTQIDKQDQTTKNDEKKESEEENKENQDQSEKSEQNKEELKEKQEEEEEEKPEKTEKTEEEEEQNQEEKTAVENTEKQQEEQLKSEQKPEEEEEEQKQSTEEEQNEKPEKVQNTEEESKQSTEEEQNEKPEEEEENQIQQSEEKQQQQPEENPQEQPQKTEEEEENPEKEQKQDHEEEEQQKEKQTNQPDQEDDHHSQPQQPQQQQEEKEEGEETSQKTENEEQPHQEEQMNEQKPEIEQNQKDQQNGQEQQQQQQQNQQEQQENDAEKDATASAPSSPNEQPTGSRTPNSKHVKLAIPVPKSPGSPSSINVTFGNEPRSTHQTFLQRSRSVIDSLGGV